MSTYISERYSELLSTDDVLTLFHRLEQKQGGIARATKICGIARKTPYLWDQKGFITPKVRKKILVTLLENDPENTLSFIVERTIDRCIEILDTALSTIYEQVMNETNADKNSQLLALFDKIRINNSGLILEKLHKEMGDMVSQLILKSRREKLDWVPARYQLFKLEQLKRIIPSVTDALQVPGSTNSEIADRYNVPTELVEQISEVMARKMVPKIQTELVIPDILDYWNREKQEYWYGHDSRFNKWRILSSAGKFALSGERSNIGPDVASLTSAGEQIADIPLAQDSSTTPEMIPSSIRLRRESPRSSETAPQATAATAQ